MNKLSKCQIKIDSQMNDGEIAKPIPNTDLDYWATSHGRIFSFKKGIRELKQSDKNGYKQVNVISGTNLVHRLVLFAFDGLPEEDQICRHLDGDPSNNHVSNLKWGTNMDNYLDSVRHGTYAIGRLGEDNVVSKLTEKDVIDIRHRVKAGEVYQSIAEDYGITDMGVYKVSSGQHWRHVGGPITKTRQATDEDIQEMIRLRKKGLTLKEIEAEVGWDYSAISRILSGRGIKRGGNSNQGGGGWTPDATIAKSVSKVQQGASVAKVAKEAGVSTSTVYKWLRNAGVSREVVGRRRGPVSDAELAKMVKLAKQGKEVEEIAKNLNRTSSLVQRYLKNFLKGV